MHKFQVSITRPAGINGWYHPDFVTMSRKSLAKYLSADQLEILISGKSHVDMANGVRFKLITVFAPVNSCGVSSDG